MSDRTIADLAKRLSAIDICMLVTKTGEEGAIASRPMSNNKDVDVETGITYHFTTDDGRIDDDLQRSDQCGATYCDDGFYAAVQGCGTLIYDRAIMEKHWVPDLEAWFEDGLDTQGLVLIEVRPARIAWWEGRDEGELKL